MSTDALEAMNEQMTAAVELNPSAEEFTLDPAGSAIIFKGIFDDSHINDKTDSGNIDQNKKIPRIEVSEILPEFVRDAIVTDGTISWTISKADTDERGISIVWLV